MQSIKPKQNLKPKYPELYPTDPKAWRQWLSRNNDSAQGVWLIVRKKNSQKRGIVLNEALDEAVSFGWIDSKLKVHDEDFYQLLFTPRKSGGTWAQNNKQRVETLIRNGKMTAAGLAKVEAAKRDGSWDRLTDVDALRLPKDFESALQADISAMCNYESLNDSMKKQILWWLESAKTDQTRAKRIRTAIEKLQSGKRNPFL